MSRTREALASAVAVLLAVAGCRDAGEVVRPDSPRTASRAAVASCDVVVPGDEPSIQDGVDAADPGDEVCVEADGGPYEEQVVVDKDLTLRGVDDPVLRAPSDPDDFTIPESGPTWEPILFAFGGSESGGAVSGTETIEVRVEGFTVDGRGRRPDARRSVGIFYRNVEGAVADNTVEEMGTGGRETFGILAYGDSDVEIRDNRVSGYERGGIGANGDGGAHPSPSAEIVGNELTGSGDGSREAWAPNGIQVGFGATGSIVGNDVEKSRWAAREDDAWAASCILVFESDDIRVRDNEVSNCDVGIGVGSWAWFLPTADGTKIVGNRVEGALIGLELEVIAWDGFSSSDPSVSNSALIRNEVSGTLGGSPGEIGVFFETVDRDPEFVPVADNNKVIANTITGFDDRIVTGSATDTKEAANRPFDP